MEAADFRQRRPNFLKFGLLKKLLLKKTFGLEQKIIQLKHNF